MSFPRLYEAGTRNFENNGFGIMSDAASCVVEEERNGMYELSMKYPINGIHFEELSTRRILLAKPNQVDEEQAFKIYSVSKPMNGFVSVKAEHISYELNGITTVPYIADSAKGALQGLQSFATSECPFTFLSTIESDIQFQTKKPESIRALMGGVEGSILDTYGGEYYFNNFRVYLYENRGENRGVVIKYGKNLTAFEQEENITNTYTHVHPFWLSADETNLVQLPEKIVPAQGSFNHTRTKIVDFSLDFDEAPTEEQLRAATEAYIALNDIGKPAISLTVSYAPLEQTIEYKHLALLERVNLCDEVTVLFPALGVESTAKAIKIRYDVIADRVLSVTLGDSKKSIVDSINQQGKDLAAKADSATIGNAITNITDTLLGAKGGSVRLLDTDSDGKFDTLYIADHEDPLQAVKVWRFNYLGWGSSSNGYSGPFTMGATLDSGFVADFITAGVLNADLIKAGVIKSKDGQAFALDVESGTISSKIPVGDDGARLETNIQPGVWSVNYYDSRGVLQSGLNFDFEKEIFTFNGTGHFAGSINVNDKFIVDGNGNLTSYGDASLFDARLYAIDEGGIGGYLATSANGISVFNRYAKELIKIGYPKTEYDYPYILLKTQSDLFKSGLVKRFTNGLWFGNSEPIDDYGNFEAKIGYQGIFFSFDDSRTYVIEGESMQNIYTGDAIARFG